jgi:hypothetical protein
MVLEIVVFFHDASEIEHRTCSIGTPAIRSRGRVLVDLEFSRALPWAYHYLLAAMPGIEGHLRWSGLVSLAKQRSDSAHSPVEDEALVLN